MPVHIDYDQVNIRLADDLDSFCAHYDCATCGQHNELLAPSRRPTSSGWLYQLGVRVVTGTTGTKSEMRRMSGVVAAGGTLDFIKKVAALPDQADAEFRRETVGYTGSRKSSVCAVNDEAWKSFACDVALSLIRCGRSDLLSSLFACHSTQPRVNSQPVSFSPVVHAVSSINSNRSSPLSFASNSSTPLIGPDLFQES